MLAYEQAANPNHRMLSLYDDLIALSHTIEFQGGSFIKNTAMVGAGLYISGVKTFMYNLEFTDNVA
jgi:hypothetical protein